MNNSTGRAYWRRWWGQLKDYFRKWLGDDLFKRFVGNSSQLLGGSVVKSGLGFVAVVLAARGLGPEKYGLLVLVQTYVLIVDNLVNFQSWQALIKYGADALEDENLLDFKCLIKIGTILDAGSAVFGTILIAAGAIVLETFGGWSSEFALMLMTYSGVVLFNLKGTPTAVLRLFDRFGLFALQKVVAGAFRLSGVGLAFMMDATIWGYMLAWMIGDVVGYILLLILGWRELVLRGYVDIFQTSTSGLVDRFPEIWSYVWTTNMSGSVKMTVRRLDNVIVATVLGTTALGLYEVVKKFSSVANRLSSPFYQAVYPELSKLWSRGDRDGFVRLVLQTTAIAGLGAFVIWGGFLVFGEPVLTYTVGMDYVEAYPVLLWYVFAVGIEVASFSFTPALLAMGHPRTQFVILVVAAALYIGVLFGLLLQFGLLGAGMAYVVFYAVWASMMAGTEIWILRTSEIAARSSG